MGDRLTLIRLPIVLLVIAFLGKLIGGFAGMPYEAGAQVFGMIIPLTVHLCIVWGGPGTCSVGTETWLGGHAGCADRPGGPGPDLRGHFSVLRYRSGNSFQQLDGDCPGSPGDRVWRGHAGADRGPGRELNSGRDRGFDRVCPGGIHTLQGICRLTGLVEGSDSNQKQEDRDDTVQ